MADCFAIWLKTKRLLSSISDEAIHERQSSLLETLGGIRGILENLLKDVDTVHPTILNQLCDELQPKESDSYLNNPSSSTQSSHILNLPEDIQNKMCQYLTIFDLKNIQLTCLSLAIIARTPFNTFPARIQLYSSSLSYDLKTRLFQSLNLNSSSLRFYFSHLTNRDTRKLLIDIGAIPRYSQLLSSVKSSKLFNDCADNLDDLCIMFPVNDPYFKLAMKQMIEYKAIYNHCNSSLGGIRPSYVSYYSSKSLRPLDSFSRLSQNSKNMILYILSNNQQDNIHGMKDLQKIFDTNAYSQGVLRQLFATGIILKFVEFCDCDNYELQLLGLKAIKHIIGLPTINDNYFSHAIVYGFIKVLQKLTAKDKGVHITLLCKIIHGIIRYKHDQLDEIKDGKWKVSITKSMINAGLNQQYQTKIYVITDMFRSIMSDGPIFENDITYQELNDIISNMVLLLNQLNDVDHDQNNNKNVNADRHFIVRARINLIWSISYLCRKSRGINDNDGNFTENIIDLCIKHGFLLYTMNQLRNGDVGSKIQWNLQILNACMYSIVMLVKNGGKHALWIKNTDFLQFIHKYMTSKATAKQVISILNAFSKLQNEAIDHLLQHRQLIQNIFSIITQHSELQSQIEKDDKNDINSINRKDKLSLSQRRQLLDVTAYKQLMMESDEHRNGNMVELATGKTAILHYMGKVHWAKRGEWFGVELTGDHYGTHDGKVRGWRYFTCPDKRGVFVKKIKGPIKTDNDQEKLHKMSKDEDDNKLEIELKNDKNKEENKLALLNSLLSPTLFCIASIIENSDDKQIEVLIEYGVVEPLLCALDQTQATLQYKAMAVIDVLLGYAQKNTDYLHAMLPFIDKLKEIENDTQRKTGLRSVARRLLRNMQQRKCKDNDFIESISP